MPQWTQCAQVLEGAELIARAWRSSWNEPGPTHTDPTGVSGVPAADFHSNLTSHISCEFDKCHPEEQLIY